MKIQDVIQYLESLAPLSYAEDFDNVGLLVGNPDTPLRGTLITLDTLEEVVEEAIAKDCNLIVSFHPIIFSGLKRLTGQSYVERAVIKAIEHHIAIYAIHTALDNSFWGVNARICDRLGLHKREILLPQAHTIEQLVTYVPKDGAEVLRQHLFEAGAGHIGNYSECSFNIEGIGTYKGNAESHPTIGVPEVFHREAETRISVIFPKHLRRGILQALLAHHPYEEVAYEIYTLENTHQHIGLGMIGYLEKPMEETTFLKYVKERMQTSCIRHSALRGKPVEKVAVLGGSGADAIGACLKAGCDAYLTADVKYHEFFKAEGRLLLADIGHYESEQFTKLLLWEQLTEKFTTFAFYLANTNTNPINYL